MADDKVEIEIVLDDGSVKKGFLNVKKEGQKTSKSLTAAFKDAFKFTELNQGLEVAKKAFNVFKGLARRVGELTDASSKQDQAVKNLNTSLQLAGRFSTEASRSFQDLATEIQATTSVGDEEVLSLAALASNFARTNEEAQKLTKAAIDLSAATGLSLEGSVKNLGKTFAGLTGELGESIPELRGLSVEALKSGQALDFVLGRFGGAAASQTQTFGGLIKQLRNIFGDFQEQLGKFVTQSPAVKALLGVISGGFGDLNKSLSGVNTDLFKDLIINFSLLAQAGVGAAKDIEFAFTRLTAAAVRTKKQVEVLLTFGQSDQLNKDLADINEAIRLMEEEHKNFAENSSTVKLFDNIIAAVRETSGTLDEFGNTAGGNTQKGAAGISDALQNVVKVSTTTGEILAKSLSAGIQKSTQALIKGENAFQAFANGALNIIGGFAIQIGTTLIQIGIGINAVAASLKTLSGGFAIAAGIALVALGTLLQSLSGGLSTPAGGGTPGASPTEDIGSGKVTEEEEVERSTSVTVNVEGQILDPVGTATKIAELLSEVTDSNDIVVNA